MNIAVSSLQRSLATRTYTYPLILTITSALLFLPGLGTRDFWAPGEPIYGEVIRVMFEKNDWLLPMLNGRLYADKPVLYFWLALIVSKIAGGVSEWTVRLPAALAGVGLVLTTFEVARTFYGRRIGFLSALVLATTNRVWWESRFLRLDTVLSFFLLLGLYFCLRAFAKRGSQNSYLLGFLCFALATLTKGPIGLLLPFLALLGLVLLTGRWQELKSMRLISGFFVIVAVLTPWLLLLFLRGGSQWLHDFIWIHNIQNYALEPIGHVRPFYYYFVNLPADFLPWTLLVPGALIYYFPWKDKLRDPDTLGLLCWFVAIFLFFSSSKSKIAYYLLPLQPALAILVGCYLGSLLSADPSRETHWVWTLIFLYCLSFALLLAGISLPVISYQYEPGLMVWALPSALVLAGGSIAMLIYLRRKKLENFFRSLFGVLIAIYFVSAIGILPYLDNYKSPRAIGEYVRDHIGEESPVYVFQSTMADFNYYARREQIPVITSGEEAARIAATGQTAYLLVNDKDLKRLKLGINFTVVSRRQVGERKWSLLKLSPMG
jgi:4-amino-4-deoxy-L-arabinose transferase-like glycosyltransferase